MRKFVLSFILLGLLAAGARADVFLSSSNPPGMPLGMTAGTTSSPLLTNVSSNTGTDVMSAWMFVLTIQPEAGATGTLTFANPPVGASSPPNPPNYIFGGDGFGINATNTGGLSLESDDTDVNFPGGATVPLSPSSANLLAIQFLASSDASGLFDIVATLNGSLSLWLDDTGSPRDFANAPDGSDFVIGVVKVTPQGGGGVTPVPEPSTLALLALGGPALAAWRWRRRRRA
jgi:hypothetical protein